MTDSTLLTPAQETPAAAAGDIQSDASVTPAAVAAPATPAETQQPAAPQAEPQKTDAKPDQAQGAPESYADFTVAEGITMHADLLDGFKGLAKELGLSQESAQKLIDLQAKVELASAEATQAALVEQSQQWAADTKADPEIGGANYDANVQTALKAVHAFASPELVQLLNDSGLGNHPAMVKAFLRIGKAISEDSIVLPGTQHGGQKSIEERLWGKSQ